MTILHELFLQGRSDLAVKNIELLNDGITDLCNAGTTCENCKNEHCKGGENFNSPQCCNITDNVVLKSIK